MSLSRAKILGYLVVLVCCGSGILARLSNWGFVFSNYVGHLNFFDTDCYYYLRRLVHFLENFPHVMRLDPLADWPSGSNVDWNEGFLLMVGIPLKLFGVDDFQSLETGVSVIMVLLGLVSGLVGFLLASSLLRSFLISLAVYFLISVNFLLVRYSGLGVVDHHILEAILPPLVLLMAHQVFTRSSMSMDFLMGLVLAFSLLISSSSLFIVGVFFVLYAVVYGSRGNYVSFLRSIAVFFFLMGGYILLVFDPARNLASIAHPSLFHLALIVVLFAVTSCFTLMSRYRIPVLLAVGGLLLGAYLWSFPHFLMRPLQMAISYVFARSGILSFVSEASPIFMNFEEWNTDFMYLNFGFLVYLMPMSWVCAIYFWKRLSIFERSFFLWFSLLSVPGIFQKRFSHLMVIGFLIFLGWLVARASAWFKNQENLLKVVLSGLVIAFTILPTFFYGFAPQGTPRDIVDLGAINGFVQVLDIKQEDVWKRLAGHAPSDKGVWTNPNLGHLTLYLTGFPVVTNSFYHPIGLNLDLKLRLMTSESELHAELLKNRIKYALLTDDFFYLDQMLELRDQKPNDIVKRVMGPTGRTNVVELGLIEKFAYARVMMADKDVVGFKRLFSTRFDVDHYYTYIKAVEIQDEVEGRYP